MTLNRLEQPALLPIAELPVFNIEKTKLSNGIPVDYINAGSQDLLRLQITLPAGIIHQEKSLQAHFTAKMLKEGSQNYSAAQIADKMDFYGAFFDIKVSRDQAVLHLISLNKYLEEVLQIIADVLLFPLFPERDLSVLVQQEKQAFLHRNKKLKTKAQKAFSKEIFGIDHPYGKHASEKDFDQITRNDLLHFYEKNYNLKHAHIYMGGRITAQTLRILETTFGHLSLKNSSLKTFDFSSSFPPLNHKEILIEENGALQSAIKIGRLCIHRSHPDFPALALTQTILGGFFGSRLMQNIREDKGYTYGIYSNIQHLQHASVFNISSEVGADVSSQAIEEIKKELKILREKEVGQTELNLVKNYMSGSLLRSLNGPFSLGEMVKTLSEYQLSDDYYANFLKGIQETSAQKVKELAQRYLNESQMIEITIGK